jgi:mono/diheme cytochrome c family protein
MKHALTLALAVVLAAAAPAMAAEDDDPQPAAIKRASLSGPRQVRASDGETIYRTLCQACHMANAQGGAGAGAFPALAKNPKLEAASYPVFMVVNGNKAMPSFKGMMSNQQIAEVVTYVRSHFGNGYADAVTAEDVKAVREAGK